MAGPMISMISSWENVTILGGTYRGLLFALCFLALAKTLAFGVFIVSPSVLIIHYLFMKNPAKKRAKLRA